MIIVLLGPPGSGKGTQSHLIAEKFLVPYLSVGEILRKAAKTRGKNSKLLNQYMDEGKLVPDDLVNSLVKQALTDEQYKNFCLLDGYPRNIKQAKFLSEFIKDLQVIYFEIDNQTIVKRLLGRYSCVDCGKIYNSFYSKPEIEGLCDTCKSTNFLYRNDDDELIINKRIEEYSTETYPLIEFYKSQANLHCIDASKGQTEVADVLESILKRV